MTTRSFTALYRLCRKMGDVLHRPQSSECTPEKQSFEQPRTTRRKTIRSLFLVCKNAVGTSPRRDAEQSRAHGTSEPSSIPTLRERRALRSLYLNTPRSPTKRYPGSSSSSPGSAEGSPLRKRMAGLFHDLRTPPPSPGFLPPSSPSTPRSRRHYHKLQDSMQYANWSNEEVYLTERPTSALISPWSPSEYEFPYPVQTLRSPQTMTSLDEPSTPPPLYPPPPAYIPEIPLRSPGSTPASPMCPEHATREASALAPPTSPIARGLEQQITRDLETWVLLRESLRDAEREDDGVFVITDETEDDTDSGCLCTEESIQL
ncbi:hypothetical protein ONZ51_g1221 [Trametes cubensis]|uniref:Uncharacterized protein n=1 Tax=Trametes cubensis TaxID=1111947 RepID=A0AAD7XHW7_9APHY|nr:hypothetical protein ONZ51_g1221 [Trametes cubensis]